MLVLRSDYHGEKINKNRLMRTYFNLEVVKTDNTTDPLLPLQDLGSPDLTGPFRHASRDLSFASNCIFYGSVCFSLI